MIVASSKLRADGALLLIALFWGVTFPLIRGALTELGALEFVALRFSLAAIAFVPLLFVGGPGARRGLPAALLPGAVLGLLAWLSYFSQTLGLTTTGAGRAAFLTGTNVVMVPLLSPLFRSGRPSRVDIGSALLALVGMFLLTDPRGTGVGVGDLWILLCALSYAFYIHGLHRVLRRGAHPTAVAFTQICAIAAMAALALPFGELSWSGLGVRSLTAIGFCALLATCATFWLQARYQSRTTPQRVAVLFSTEPVFAAFFAYWILGETLSLLSAVGAGVILVAVLGGEWLNLRDSGEGVASA